MQENPIVQEISSQALTMLSAYHWPENILELERVLFKAILASSESLLNCEHIAPYLPPKFTQNYINQASPTQTVRSRKMALTCPKGEVRKLRDLEADMIHFALAHYDGHISKVARKLGIGRSTLYRKLNDLNINVA